jgi:hypothetical protein
MRRRRSSSRSLAAALTLFTFGAPASVAWADGTPSGAPDDAVVRAREDFLKGADLANHAQWGEALAAFERSAGLRPHAITTFNIGACERAMGSYTLARETLRKALTENDAAHGTELPEMLVEDAHAYLAEIERLLATVSITLSPADGRVGVDGRPLFATASAGEEPLTLVAGVREPGPGEMPLPAAAARPEAPLRFRVLLNPGTRVFTLSHVGFADAVISKSFSPGSSTELKLLLDRLPGTVHLASEPTGAAVMLDGVDVGATPLDVTRPSGTYHVVMRKPGFAAYDTRFLLRPGEEVNLSPTLPKEKVLLTQRWWFWTSVGAVVAGVAAGTALYVRAQEPGPAPTPPTGGTLGWTQPLH